MYSATVCAEWTRRIYNVWKCRNKGKCSPASNVDDLIVETCASVDMRRENAASWSDIPTSALRAELLRRQTADHDRPTCGRAGNTNDYNMPLHVFALVLILVLSTLGQSRHGIPHCSFSLTMSQHARSQFLFDGYLACPYLVNSFSCPGTLAPAS